MNSLFHWVSLVAVMAAPIVRAADTVTVLTVEHTDLVVLHQPDQTPPLRLAARAETTLEATNVLLTVAESARLSVPDNANFAFLGAVGDPIWILPASQNRNLLYMGFASDAASPPLTAYATNVLAHVSAPGRFFVWQTSSGVPNVFIDAGPGESGPTNRVPVANPGHAHYNFGFSTSGVYRVTFRAEAALATGGLIQGTNDTFVFHVAPLNAFEMWQTNHWSPTAPERVVEAGADPDGDGWVNLAEFAMALDPKVADRSQAPRALVVTEGDQRYGAVRYRRSKTAVGSTLLVTARDGVDGSDETPLTDVVSIEDLGEAEAITVRDSRPLTGSTQRVYRITVSMP